MPTDVETQLRDLGHQFRAEMIHVHADEILDRSSPDARREAGTIIHLANPSSTRRRTRWLMAVAAASLLVLVTGLVVIAQRDESGVGVNDRPEACQDADDTVSFDAQTFPAFDSDIAETGYLSATAAADAYLADRASAAANDHGIVVSYELVGGTRDVGPNTIVRANLNTETAHGTVDIATRRVETTDGGPRWIVQAAASNVASFPTATFTDGRVTVSFDSLATGSAYAATHDPSSGDEIDVGGAQITAGVPAGSIPPALLDLVAGTPNPILRYWFVNVDTIEFTEIQLNQGYPDFGEGWRALQQLQRC
jgi:polyisoprenoid-binding protein YceI